MIERIYIPTVRRSDKQFTYDNLPAELQEKVIMVIDPSERDLYNYPCEYLELPDSIIGQWTQLSQTRKFIHKHAGNIKYALIDDDLILCKRNSKYFGEEPDMDISKRLATEDEIIRMFNNASEWLDDEDIGVVGMSDGMTPPPANLYDDTIGVFGYLFLDGKKISRIADDLDTSIRVAEDLLFLFECMSNGINTRRSNEFLYINKSDTSHLKDSRPIWEEMFDNMPADYFQTKEHYESLYYIRKKFPHALTILEKDGRMKNIKHWKKIYNPKDRASLDIFFK